MPFSPGDPVHVTGLGKGIVREVRNGGRCLVELKGRSVVVSESQLAPHDGSKRKHEHAAVTVTGDPTGARSHVPASIDLHGMTAGEAVAAVDTFLNDAMLASMDEVRIVHGRSGGTLRSAVHMRLQQVASVRSYRLDPANPGVTIVTL